LVVLVVAIVFALHFNVLNAIATGNTRDEGVIIEVIDTSVQEETAETIPTVEETEVNVPEWSPRENYTDIVEFEGREYTIPYIFQNKEPGVTESGYVEKITEVPLYIQHYYRDVPYGGYGSVATHGCGICSAAMVYTYLLDEEITPEYLAGEYGRFNTKVGSSWGLFAKTAEDLGLTVTQTHQWSEALEALNDGKILIVAANSKSVFTDSGHFIVFYGITEDGKILVKDPSIYNYGQWSGDILKEGFKNGFEEKNVKYNCGPFWIYDVKDLDAIAARTESENQNLDTISQENS
jgi:hypothetical protein